MDIVTTHASRYEKPELTPERKALYDRLDAKHVAPLWEVLSKIIPASPTPETIPALWRYDELRPLLMEAGRLLTAKEAERRVIVLENPGVRGQSKITQSLYSGLQMILPGEIAVCHRHAASALRFVIEGTAAYTAVEGERTTMHPGDFILTPSWSYHDHGNPGDDPVVWLDGLDIPLVNMFDSSFFERHPEERQPNVIPEGDALARYGGNMMPVDYAPTGHASPIFNYPYSQSRDTLDRLCRFGPVNPCHGVKMRYINPATGGSPMPTIGAFIQLLPKGFRGLTHRATDATVFSVVEGSGRTMVGDQPFVWGPRDLFVVPSWYPVAHEADAESVLFSFSDRPAQQALGVWRQEAPVRA